MIDIISKIEKIGDGLNTCTWKEMLLHEGVYQSTTDDFETCRLIVLKQIGGSVVLYIDVSCPVLDIAVKSDWNGHEFVKTNETIELNFLQREIE